MGDTLRLIMDLAGLQDESVHAESHGPHRRLDNLSLVKTVTFRDGFAERRPQYRQFRSQRFENSIRPRTK